MPAQTGVLKDHLSRYRQIKITVKGRKSGRAITHTIWFVFEGDTLYLLPVRGSETQWYKNVLKNPKMAIEARGAEIDVSVVAVTEPKAVASVVERFRQKYGAGDVKKYYANFDVAVTAEVS